VKKLPLPPINILKNVITKDLFFVILTMQHITGISRQELQMSRLEDKIGTENPVRFVDAFVEHISLASNGFTTQTIKSGGKHEKTNRFLKSKKERLLCLYKWINNFNDNLIVGGYLPLPLAHCGGFNTAFIVGL
jgi:hypothetical protein